MKLQDILLTEALDAAQIEQWLKKMKVKNFTVNPNLTVDVDGDVNLFQHGIDNFPFQWGTIKGNFLMRHNKLKSFARFPKVITGDLSVAHNPGFDPFKVKPGIKLQGELLMGNNWRWESLVGLSKVFKELGDNRSDEASGLNLLDAHNYLKHGGLELLNIPHCKFIFRSDHESYPAIKALTIIKSYEDKPQDIFECQEELEEKGLGDFAEV